jgi:hypothetical protein
MMISGEFILGFVLYSGIAAMLFWDYRKTRRTRFEAFAGVAQELLTFIRSLDSSYAEWTPVIVHEKGWGYKWIITSTIPTNDPRWTELDNKLQNYNPRLRNAVYVRKVNNAELFNNPWHSRV